MGNGASTKLLFSRIKTKNIGRVRVTNGCKVKKGEFSSQLMSCRFLACINWLSPKQTAKWS